MNFSELMEAAMDGSLTEVCLPSGCEKAGVILPSMFLMAARQPDDPFNSALLEASSKVMESVFKYIDEELLSDEEMLEAASEFIGRECPTGGDPLHVGDLIKVRLSWRMDVADNQMTVLVWHTIIPGIQKVEGCDSWAILWPQLDARAEFWPPRILNAALRDALFSAGLHELLSRTTIHHKH